MLHGSFIHTSVTIRVSAFIFILVEVALGRLYAIDQNLSLDQFKLLPPVVQHLEIPEVPPEYEDDDKPSKFLDTFIKLLPSFKRL